MRRFIEGKISVKCNKKEELNEFLKLCEKHKLEWQDGEKPTEWSPLGRLKPISHARSRRIVLPIIISCENLKISYLEDGYWELKWLENEIVDFQDFMNKESKILCI